MRFWIRIALETYRRFVADDGWAIASHIALSALTSLFPFLIFVAALAGFLGSQELADEATRLLLESWPDRVAGPLSAEIHDVLTQPRGGLLTLGAALALYFSSSAVEALRIGLNRAYDLRDNRPWWLLRIESVAYVLVGATSLLLLALLVILAPLLSSAAGDRLGALFELPTAFAALRFSITVAGLGVALVIAHKWLPAGRRAMRDIAPGVLLTLTLSMVFAVAFGRYLAAFATNYVSTYAGLASVMIAIVFLYTLGCIFLLGGELNAALDRARAVARSRADS